jgi:hypothetical protein
VSPCTRSANVGTVLITASRIARDDCTRARALPIIPEDIWPKRTAAGVTSGVVAAGALALPWGAPAFGSVLDVACALCATPAAMESKDAEMPANAHAAVCEVRRGD